MQVTHRQQFELQRILEQTPWGDVAGALEVIDEGLATAMRATREDFRRWETNHEDAGYVDEFSIDDVAGLSSEWRSALVARLLRSIAMAYGVGTDYASDEIGDIKSDDRSTAAMPLREILDVLS